MKHLTPIVLLILLTWWTSIGFAQPAPSSQPLFDINRTSTPLSAPITTATSPIAKQNAPPEKNTAEQTLPLLKPRKTGVFTKSNTDKKTTVPGSPEALGLTFGLLAVIVIGILIAARVMRKHGPVAGRSLPIEAFEPLGRRALSPRQAIHFFRCGTRILVVGSSDEGLQTLAEITDPVEVDSLSGICRSDANGSGPNEMFRNLFQKAFSSGVKRPHPTATQPSQQPSRQSSQLEHATQQLDRAVQQQQSNQQQGTGNIFTGRGRAS